jgi:hypothetical protein
MTARFLGECLRRKRIMPTPNPVVRRLHGDEFLKFAAYKVYAWLAAELCGGFGDEEAAEAVVDELDADEAFAGFAVADVDYAALGGKIVIFVFATCAGLRKRDADVEVGTDGNVEAGAESSAATAKIFTRCGFLECDAAGVHAANGNR